MRFILPRFLALLLLLIAPLTAADSTTGIVEGRVSNPATGEFFERARITVEGTSLEAFTDTSGFYRLASVPVGAARVRVFFTGLPPQISSVTVAAGRTAVLDFNLSPAAGRAGEVVKLSEFVVATSKEMEAAAIAINEQRFAPNLKGVVSTDEFGNVAEGSVGEFLKFVPGVSIEYEAGALARGISINGTPSEYTPIMVNGFNLASAGGNSATARTTQMDMTSITATSRIEVVYSPTPETPAAALAGSINMIPRSAFERSRPELKINTYVMMRDSAKEPGKTPGPFEASTYKIKPGFDFSYVRPVTRDFGFTLSGGHSDNGTTEEFISNAWRGVSQTTNGTTFPHTTADNPYLTQTQVREGTKKAARTSFGATVDWRFSPNDRLSFSYQHYFIDFLVLNHVFQYTINGVSPGNFTPFSTRGNPGAGQLQLSNNFRDRTNATVSPSLIWRHDGPVWKMEAGIGQSRARNAFRAVDKGYFSTSTAQRSNVTVSFADIFYLRPNTVTVTDPSGAIVDPTNLNNYSLTAASSNPITSQVVQSGAQGSLQRDFTGQVPFQLKLGFDLRHDQRDQRQANYSYAFVGADGRGSTTPIGNDDGASRFLAVNYSERPAPWGFPKWQRVDNVRLWDYYKANPSHLTLDENAKYRSETGGSKYGEELVSSAYVRGDLQLIDRRLKLVGGLRAEQTNIDARGPLTDPTRNYRRDTAGNLILTNGRPTPIVATTNSLDYSKLTYIERGQRTEKEYLRWFPSLNASFNVREDLIARAAYYHSIGRPDFNQYGGGLTLPDETSVPSPTNRISVNNAAIKPWTARSVSARLEYYFEGVGQVSAGGFQREFSNFFGNVVLRPTPEFLALYGLDPNVYGAYDVATNNNVTGTVRMSGADFSYKQALTFLPRWARGVHVFGNISVQRPTGGDATANFQSYIRRRAAWGYSLVREKFNFRMNWSFQDKNRGSALTGTGLEPGTYQWQSSRLFLDVLGEYYFTKRVGVYFTMRNVKDTGDQQEVEGPSTPLHAQFRSREQAGSLWTIGVKGTF